MGKGHAVVDVAKRLGIREGVLYVSVRPSHLASRSQI
ncbi:hypothetical protein [Limnohabitans sp.]